MAKKREYSPKEVEFVDVDGIKYAKTTKKNDLISIPVEIGGEYVVTASKGNDAIRFEGFNTVADLKDTSKITFEHVTGTKDLMITILGDTEENNQTVKIENFYKKTAGKSTASSLKNVKLVGEDGTIQYVSIIDEGLIDYESVINVNKKGKATGTIFNDTLYGFGKMKIKTEEQVLQSYYLKFINPFSSELIELKIDEDDKIKKVLNYLRNL